MRLQLVEVDGVVVSCGLRGWSFELVDLAGAFALLPCILGQYTLLGGRVGWGQRYKPFFSEQKKIGSE